MVHTEIDTAVLGGQGEGRMGQIPQLWHDRKPLEVWRDGRDAHEQTRDGVGRGATPGMRPAEVGFVSGAPYFHGGGGPLREHKAPRPRRL